jgi:DNA-damage-inducible protein J
MEEDEKRKMEEACKEMGMTMTTAYKIFTAKVIKEQRIPFEISVDPFYSEANMNRLRKAIGEIESGEAKLIERELVEVGDA